MPQSLPFLLFLISHFIFILFSSSRLGKLILMGLFHLHSTQWMEYWRVGESIVWSKFGTRVCGKITLKPRFFFQLYHPFRNLWVDQIWNFLFFFHYISLKFYYFKDGNYQVIRIDYLVNGSLSFATEDLVQEYSSLAHRVVCLARCNKFMACSFVLYEQHTGGCYLLKKRIVWI